MSRRTELRLPAKVLTTFLISTLALGPAVLAKPRDRDQSGVTSNWSRINRNADNAAPTISGVPQDTVVVGSFYEFVPEAYDPDSENLVFAIRNQPVWAEFDPTTGAIWGTPTAEHLGYYDRIRIRVTDSQSRSRLPRFAIEVVAQPEGDQETAPVLLEWQAPLENEDGSALTDLAGYRIYYGTDMAQRDEVIELSNPSLSSFVVEGLSVGMWYFSITAFNTLGVESAHSDLMVFDTQFN